MYRHMYLVILVIYPPKGSANNRPLSALKGLSSKESINVIKYLQTVCRSCQQDALSYTAARCQAPKHFLQCGVAGFVVSHAWYAWVWTQVKPFLNCWGLFVDCLERKQMQKWPSIYVTIVTLWVKSIQLSTLPLQINADQFASQNQKFFVCSGSC